MFLVLLVLLFSVPTANAQLYFREKSSQHFMLPGFQMTLSNNFESAHHPYSPVYIALPFKDEYFTVYGEHLILSAFKRDSLIQLANFQGGLFRDSSLQDSNAFPFAALQARVVRNGAVLRDWQYISNMTSFEDRAVTYTANPRKPAPSYWLVNDTLAIGDSILIELRKKNEQPFLRLHAKRENAHTQPFMMSYLSDSSTSTELSFISKQLLYSLNRVYDTRFYSDWPGGGLQLRNARVSANSRLAFYFREETSHTMDSIYSYRILGGQYKDTAWQKTDGLILMASLLHNADYTLEVKYADGHGQLSTYTFNTPPLWYQTSWFKIIIFALAVAILLLLFFVSRARKNKRKMKYLQLEMQALHAQMNPHFLFNALGSIQGLMNDQQTAKANKYLTGFATLLRSAVSQGSKAFVPLSVELKNLDNYIELERLRFGFRYELEVSPAIQTDQIDVPPLLAQPLIENAAKHGLSGKRENGMLRIHITKENADLLFLVIDDGNGFDPDKPANGHGIRLTQARIALFNRMYKYRKILLEISSSSNGTRCCLRFKNWMDND